MDGMDSPTAYVTIVTTSILTFITGETLNVGILITSFENLKRAHNPAEFIYFCMGSANVVMEAVQTVLTILCIYFSDLFNTREVYVALFSLMSFLIYYSFWLTAWLCVHYCVTIVNFNHRVFVWLKGLLSSFWLHVVIISVVMPFLLSPLAVWFIFAALHLQCPNNYTSASILGEIHVVSPAYPTVNLLVGSVLPFSVAFLSTGITASSLIRHMGKMKQKLSGFSAPNLQATSHATKTMILFLSLSVSFYASELLVFSVPASNISDILAMTSWFVIMSFPTAEAAIIIQASPKIKRAFLGRFCAWAPGKAMTKT